MNLFRLQQYLSFTVLKLSLINTFKLKISKLQQYLPFTVLKLFRHQQECFLEIVATVLTVYGIETPPMFDTDRNLIL